MKPVNAMVHDMAPGIRVKDYRGLTALSPEQQLQLHQAREQNDRDLRRTQAANSYTFLKDMPTAKLNSGYDIPCIGLGTW